MTDIDAPVSTAAVSAPTGSGPSSPLRFARRAAPWLILVLVYLIAPFKLDSFWLQVLLLSGATAVAALGLRFLVGVSGQLSLAHAFFVGIGAYAYAKLGPHLPGAAQGSAGLPSAMAALAAVLITGLVGLIFSPVAARLRGIYLGLASLSLVVFGTALLTQANSLGGVYGIQVASLNFGSFSFWASSPGTAILGTPFGTMQRLWFLIMLVLALVFAAMRRLERSRTGRALKSVRDSPAVAASVGVHVQSYRSLAFVVSSLSAGVAGVLLALVYQNIVPDDFGLTLSVLYLAMVVIGGPRSPVGTMLGALVVTGLPLVLTKYAQDFPLVAQPGQNGGLDPGTVSDYVFGIVMIIVLLARNSQTSALLARGRAMSRRSRTPAHRPPAGGQPAPTDTHSAG
jgi:branched-chain amino acid transport system permease protein